MIRTLLTIIGGFCVISFLISLLFPLLPIILVLLLILAVGAASKDK
jgi:hypothetical protein